MVLNFNLLWCQIKLHRVEVSSIFMFSNKKHKKWYQTWMKLNFMMDNMVNYQIKAMAYGSFSCLPCWTDKEYEMFNIWSKMNRKTDIILISSRYQDQFTLSWSSSMSSAANSNERRFHQSESSQKSPLSSFHF
jgi:hypothetical protein